MLIYLKCRKYRRVQLRCRDDLMTRRVICERHARVRRARVNAFVRMHSRPRGPPAVCCLSYMSASLSLSLLSLSFLLSFFLSLFLPFFPSSSLAPLRLSPSSSRGCVPFPALCNCARGHLSVRTRAACVVLSFRVDDVKPVFARSHAIKFAGTARIRNRLLLTCAFHASSLPSVPASHHFFPPAAKSACTIVSLEPAYQAASENHELHFLSPSFPSPPDGSSRAHVLPSFFPSSHVISPRVFSPSALLVLLRSAARGEGHLFVPL